MNGGLEFVEFWQSMVMIMILSVLQTLQEQEGWTLVVLADLV